MWTLPDENAKGDPQQEMKGIIHSDRRYHRVLGVDPATRGIACSVVDHDDLVATMKIQFGDGDIYDKIKKARQYFPKILDLYNPEVVVIEQSIFVQNHDTARKMSYVVGVLMGEVLIRGIVFNDVPPASWKSFVGARPIRQAEKDKVISELGQTEGKKEIKNRRKNQVQEIMKKQFPAFNWSDDDIADSCGIALWGYDKYGRED